MNKQKKTKKITKIKKTQGRTKAGGPTAIGSALRALGGLGGGVLGGMLGNSSLGSAAGSGLGGLVSKWLGQGDYTVTSNSLVNRVRTSGDIPNMHSTGQSILVRHKEYIGDVTSSTTFAVGNTIVLNPGLSASFPWLSTIAQQYQEYTWKGIVFEFVSTSGDVVASTNTALGSVMMATQYRSTAATYLNKVQMLNEFFASDAKPSECFSHPIECNPKENPYNVQYVRSGAVPAGEDAKTYDIGTTYLATQGMQAGSIDIGELWVSYEVELRKPVISGLLDFAGDYANFKNTVGVAAATPFGTAGSATSSFNSIGVTITATVITFPIGSAGNYFVEYGIQDCTAADTSNFGGTSTNLTLNNVHGTVYTVGTSFAYAVGVVTITDPTKAATWTPTVTTATGASSMRMTIVQIPATNNGF